MGRERATTEDTGLVRGHELPGELARVMHEGDWKAPPHSEEWNALFPKHNGIDEVRLYDLRLCRRETDHLVRNPMPEAFASVRGSDDPDELDPARAVLIGDLGMDQPIALDYRTNPPRLVYSVLHQSPRWHEVAGTLSHFIEIVRREGAEDRRERDIWAALPPPVRIAARYAEVRKPQDGFACRGWLAGRVGERIRLFTLPEIIDKCTDMRMIGIGEAADGRSIALDYGGGEPAVVVGSGGSWSRVAVNAVRFYRGMRLGWWKNTRVPTGAHAPTWIGLVWHAIVRWGRWGV